MPLTTSATRRAQRREATLAEIRTAARSLLAEAGADAVTLRGIAAELGMAASGVHYYYASRDELLTALIIDAFNELAAATAEATHRAGRRRTRLQQWTDAALSYRAWALAHPELFQLAHSATAAQLKSRPGLLEAKNLAARALTDPLAAAVDERELDIHSEAPPVSRILRDQLRRYADAAQVAHDPHLQLFLLQGYTLVHGAVALAATGSLPRELLEDDSLFHAQLARLLPAAPRRCR